MFNFKMKYIWIITGILFVSYFTFPALAANDQTEQLEELAQSLEPQDRGGDGESQDELNSSTGSDGADYADQQAEPEGNFDRASMSVQEKLEASLAELDALRDQIAEEKIPLSRKLSDLEAELVEVRREYQQTTRLLDSRTLDLSNLRTEIKKRKEEATYLSNLLGEYARNFESRLHIAEIQRYKDIVEEAKLAPENSNLSAEEVYKAQAKLIEVSLERLEEALGGTSFEGTAVDPSGLVKHGKFVMLGPIALFRSDDGQRVGTAEQRLGSLEPAIIEFGDPADTAAAAEFVMNKQGTLPVDPSLGNAHKIEQTKETLVDHIKKGGPVMYPIFTLAGAALLVAILKWLHMLFIRTPGQKKINRLLDAVARHDEVEAKQKAKSIKGPVGKMLYAGVEHIRQPVELVEEVMYEKVLATRLKLEKFLPFIAITAASAPLLGLLGTVTGIINTFKLITVFGSGDVKTLSGGISEALITTEFGLIVAIPSLLLHAFLSRKAKSVVNQMEKAAVALVNQISKTPYNDSKKDKNDINDAKEILSRLAAGQKSSRPTEKHTAVTGTGPMGPGAGVQGSDTAGQDDSGGHSRFGEFLEDVAGNGPSSAKYSNDSAGAVMNTKVLSINANFSVGEAIDKIRSCQEDGDIDGVFIVDDSGKYIGYVTIGHLVRHPENYKVGSLADQKPFFVRVDTHKNEARDLFDKHNIINIPVLDHNDQLVGRLTRTGNGDGK